MYAVEGRLKFRFGGNAGEVAEESVNMESFEHLCKVAL